MNEIKKDIVIIAISVILSVNITTLILTTCNKPNGSVTQTQTQTVTVSTEEPDKININNCSKEALEHLSNIGDILADRIINNRPYIDIYELKNVSGIDDKIFNSIKEYVETGDNNVLPGN